MTNLAEGLFYTMLTPFSKSNMDHPENMNKVILSAKYLVW